MGKIAISTESISDIPAAFLKARDIHVIYLDVITDQGVFIDGIEVSDRNIIEYMAGGERKALSRDPSPEIYLSYFRKLLAQYDEVIHVGISSKIAESHKNAVAGVKLMGAEGGRVHIVDSQHLSSGLGIMVFQAADLRDEGKRAEEIISEILAMRSKVSTTFIAKSLDYLYYNDRIDKKTMTLCRRLHLHPVLVMKDGTLTVKKILFGNYDKAVAKYVKSELKQPENIRQHLGFITYAGCSHERLDQIEQLVSETITFDQLIQNPASAAVSCNCGPDSLGVLFVRK